MEVEEIKQEYSMRDILARYGIQVNRSGMCCCPIHGERHPSMKVYKDSFYCFACGAHGDIFSFIQQMDNCDFKTAYLSLGGTYEKQTENERAVTIARRERAKSERERAKQQEEQQNGQAQTHCHCGANQKLLKARISQFLFQPLIKF